MSRHGYTDDGDFCECGDCGECDLCAWREQVREAQESPSGQAFLRELAESVAQEPGLCSGVLLNTHGMVCAIGSVVRRRGVQLEPEDDEDYSEWAPDEVAALAGIPEPLAQEIMHENDETGGTPESLRDHMVAWAKARII